jgi:hypothetical protein
MDCDIPEGEGLSVAVMLQSSNGAIRAKSSCWRGVACYRDNLSSTDALRKFDHLSGQNAGGGENMVFAPS